MDICTVCGCVGEFGGSTTVATSVYCRQGTLKDRATYIVGMNSRRAELPILGVGVYRGWAAYVVQVVAGGWLSALWVRVVEEKMVRNWIEGYQYCG